MIKINNNNVNDYMTLITAKYDKLKDNFWKFLNARQKEEILDLNLYTIRKEDEMLSYFDNWH